MKLFASIFFGIGLLVAFIGLGWFYVFISTSEGSGFSEEWIGPLRFTIIGLIFASVGNVIKLRAVGSILYYNNGFKSVRSGRKLRAVISNVYFNNTITIINRHPRVIECLAELSGQKQNFKSHNVWSAAPFEMGQEVAVYVDTRNSTNYWEEVGE